MGKEENKMASSPEKKVAKGMSVLTVVGIVFIILKLTSLINWSWWLVLLPFYGPFAIFLAVCGITGFVMILLKGGPGHGD